MRHALRHWTGVAATAALGAFILLGSVHGVAAPAPPASTAVQPEQTAGISMVVELVVEDAKGKPVTDLRAAEISLIQERVRQQVASLRPLSSPGHYEMTYLPVSGKPGGIIVRILRPGTRVRGPRGEFLQPRVVRLRTGVEKRLANLLETRPDANDFPCFVAALVFEGTPEGLHHALAVEVPLDPLVTAESPSPVLQSLLQVKDAAGRVVERVSLDRPLEIDQAKTNTNRRLVWTGNVHLKPGHYSVEAVVFQPATARASVRSFSFEAAEPKPGLRVASVTLLQPTSFAIQDTARQDDDPLYFAGQPLMPSLEGKLENAESVTIPFFAVAYADPADPAAPSMQMELLRDGELRGTYPLKISARDARGAVRFFGNIRARGLRPGAYGVRIVARQGQASASQETSFDLHGEPVAATDEAGPPISVPRPDSPSRAPVASGAPPGFVLKRGPEGGPLAVAIDLLRRARFDEAVSRLKALDKQSGGTSGECLLALAIAYRSLGAEKDALATARRAVEATQDPVILAQAYEMIGRGLAVSAGKGRDEKTRSRLEEADAALSKSLELYDNAPLARTSRGRASVERVIVLLRLGRRADAESIAEALAKDESTSADLRARAYQMLSNQRCLDEPCAPDFAFVTAEGEHQTLGDLKGRVVLLSFWASWCSPCVQAMPDIRDLRRRFAKDPFVVVGINMDSSREDMKEAIARHRVDWPQAWDDHRLSEGLYGVRGIPAEIVIDHEGVIVGRSTGWGQATSTALSQRIHEAVKAAKKAAPNKVAPDQAGQAKAGAGGE